MIVELDPSDMEVIVYVLEIALVRALLMAIWVSGDEKEESPESVIFRQRFEEWRPKPPPPNEKVLLVSASILTGAVRQVGRTSRPKKSESLLLLFFRGIDKVNSGWFL